MAQSEASVLAVWSPTPPCLKKTPSPVCSPRSNYIGQATGDGKEFGPPEETVQKHKGLSVTQRKREQAGEAVKTRMSRRKMPPNSASIHTACIGSICLYGREAGNGESQSVSQAHYIKKQCAWEQEHRESLKVRYFFSLQANLPVGRPYLGAWGLEHTCATHGL